MPLEASIPVDNTVPRGTVASRILHLQSLASSAQIDHLENRASYGRRASSRFGQPASVTTRPDKKHQIARQHSYIGLNARRKGHERELTVADPRNQWDRPAGLHSQLRPSGLPGLTQFEATSPWAVFAKSKSYQNLRQQSRQPFRAELAKKLEERKDSLTLSAPTDSDEVQICYPPPKKPYDDATSVDTTSTMRRESVMNLYSAYGIEKPAGLVSTEREDQTPDDQTQQLARHRYCHRCTWMNGLERRCWRCGHVMCQLCDGLDFNSNGTHTKRDEDPGDAQSRRRHMRSVTKAEENRDVTPKRRQHKSEAHPYHLYLSKEHTTSASDQYSEREECKSPSCRATHAGHRPYRHSISCTLKRLSQQTGTSDSKPIQHKKDVSDHALYNDQALQHHSHPHLQIIEYHMHSGTGHVKQDSQVSPNAMERNRQGGSNGGSCTCAYCSTHVVDDHTASHDLSPKQQPEYVGHDRSIPVRKSNLSRAQAASQGHVIMPVPQRNLADLPWMTDKLGRGSESGDMKEDAILRKTKSKPSLGALRRLSVQGQFARPDRASREDSGSDAFANATPTNILKSIPQTPSHLSSVFSKKAFTQANSSRNPSDSSRISQITFHNSFGQGSAGAQGQVRRASSMMIMNMKKRDKEARTESRTDAGLEEQSADLDDFGIDGVSIVIHLKGKPDLVMKAALEE